MREPGAGGIILQWPWYGSNGGVDGVLGVLAGEWKRKNRLEINR